jgi:hypothetical protein
MTTAILFKCHYMDETVMHNLAKLKAEAPHGYKVFILWDSTNKPIRSDAFNFDYQTYLNCDYRIADCTFLNTFKGVQGFPTEFEQQVIWHNPEYPVMLFYLQNREFDYYYSIEYDVSFNGDWSDFFKACEDSTADFLACNLRDKATNDIAIENYWDLINFECEEEQKFAAFGAIQRYSNEMLRIYDKFLRNGLFGYYEITMPTIAKIANLEVKDFLEVDKLYHIGTMGCMVHPYIENMLMSGKYENCLFHPVKRIYNAGNL